MLKIEDKGGIKENFSAVKVLVLKYKTEALEDNELTGQEIYLENKMKEEMNTITENDNCHFGCKKLCMFAFVLMAVAVTPVFAQNSGVLDGAVSKVTSFLSSGLITAVCLIALVVEGIGVVVMGKQGADIQAIIGKFAPWVVGTVVLLSANGICNYFLADLSFSGK